MEVRKTLTHQETPISPTVLPVAPFKKELAFSSDEDEVREFEVDGKPLRSHFRRQRSIAYDIEEDEEDEDDAIDRASATADDVLHNEVPIRSGYLLKKGEKRRTWKKRWFVLRSTRLAYYKDSKEYELLHNIEIEDIHSVGEVLGLKDKKYVFSIVTPRRTYYIQAEDRQDMEEWISAMAELIKASEDGESPRDRLVTERQPIGIHLGKTNTEMNFFTSDIANSSEDEEFLPDHTGEHSLAAKPSTSDVGVRHQPSSASHNVEHTADALNSLRISLPDDAEPSAPQSIPHPAQPAGSKQVSYLKFASTTGPRADDESEQRVVLSEEDRNRVLWEGYLQKLTRNRTWRKRWFVLRNNSLAYYKNNKEYAPQRIIPASSIIDALEIDAMSKHKLHCMKLIVPKRAYILCADTQEELEQCLNGFATVIERVRGGQEEEDT
ncbi:hypothetical protein BZG36_02411 [Bifiguratus adelaidae]|uniref:PH domain-containing protein n=1 Tax=Bifiguratus adelaidae TaxID=1938954 RepID=A0A261Y1L2_9FUNG|nr:hypothetical protein BZG36_02411 [Bifiguratus adelaidae]